MTTSRSFCDMVASDGRPPSESDMFCRVVVLIDNSTRLTRRRGNGVASLGQERPATASLSVSRDLPSVPVASTTLQSIQAGGRRSKSRPKRANQPRCQASAYCCSYGAQTDSHASMLTFVVCVELPTSPGSQQPTSQEMACKFARCTFTSRYFPPPSPPPTCHTANLPVL
jgi:hypothetical protein